MPEREIEAKFEVQDPSWLHRLQKPTGLPPGFELSPLQLHVHEDTYVDTPGYRLLRRGYVLRVRTTPAEALVTLKGLERQGLGAIHERFELEGPITPAGDPLDPAAWPHGVRLAILGLLGEEAAFQSICRLRQERSIGLVHRLPAPPDAVPSPTAAPAPVEGGPPAQEWSAEGPAGGPGVPDGTAHAASTGPRAAGSPVAVAELSFDDVAVFGPDAASQAEASGSDEAHTPVAKWRELELELADPAERAPFEELHRFFSRQDRLVAARASKLERAFTLLATHPAGSAPGVLGVQTWQPMAEAGRVVWRQQLAAVLLNEAGARRGDDIEYVHDMRVATRRARSAARLFGAYYEERAVEELLAAMRKTAETLGAVRDLDVQLDKLARFAKTAPAEVAPDLEVIAAAWREERQAATAALFEWLDSKAYRRFIRDWARFCHTAGLGAHSLQRKSRPSPVPAQVRHVMPSRIMERYEQVRCYEALFEGGEPIPEATLHALRIDCKRLRYVLEPVLHLLNRDGPALVRQLKGLQDHLGDLNDAAVTRARLQELQKRVDHPAVEHYLAVQEEIIAELGRTFPEVWAPFITTSNRRLMARAIARL